MAIPAIAMVFTAVFLTACRSPNTQSRTQDAGSNDAIIKIVRDTFPFLENKNKELVDFANMLRRKGGGGAISPENLAQLETENGAEFKIYVTVEFLARTTYIASLVSNDVNLRVINP
jgi:PleD family two-component response regulator